MDMPQPLPLAEAAAIVRAVAEMRGYPVEAAVDVAQRGAWLEARGLPGLSACAAELLRHRGTDPLARGPLEGEDGTVRFRCPFMAGAALAHHLPTMGLDSPEAIRGFDGPDQPMLVLPTVAAYAAQSGKVLRLAWIVEGSPKALSVTDGERLIGYGEAQAIVRAEGAAVSLSPDPLPPEAKGPHRETAALPPGLLEALLRFAVGAGPEDDLDALAGRDEATATLWRALSDGERSTYAAFAFDPKTVADAGAVLTALPDGANGAMHRHLAALGWMEPATDLPAGEGVGVHRFTERGRRLLPQMVAYHATRPLAQGPTLH